MVPLSHCFRAQWRARAGGRCGLCGATVAADAVEDRLVALRRAMGALRGDPGPEPAPPPHPSYSSPYHSPYCTPPPHPRTRERGGNLHLITLTGNACQGGCAPVLTCVGGWRVGSAAGGAGLSGADAQDRPHPRWRAAGHSSSPPVLTGHAASLLPYQPDTPRPFPRTNRTRRVPSPVPVGHATPAAPCAARLRPRAAPRQEARLVAGDAEAAGVEWERVTLRLHRRAIACAAEAPRPPPAPRL
jgi:hypothetical protein